MIDKTNLVRNVLDVNIRKLCSFFELEYRPEIMKELEDDYGFIEAINLKVVKNDVFRKRSFESIYQFSVYRNLLYYMLRITKPKIVVETGVLHGLTSAWMLKAI